MPSVGEHVEQPETLKHCQGEYTLGQPLWKTVGQFPWTYLREMHAGVFQNAPC